MKATFSEMRKYLNHQIRNVSKTEQEKKKRPNERYIGFFTDQWRQTL